MHRIFFNATCSVFFVSLLVLVGFIESPAQKLTVEEVIAKHVASIGNSDVVAKSKLRMAIGTSYFRVRSPAKDANGTAILASNGIDVAFFSTFDMRDYPTEKIGLFGNKIDIRPIDQNRRSPLGSFLNAYDKYLNNRILGGSILSSWLFLGSLESGSKLELEGKKKVGGRDAWVVRFYPKGGMDSSSYIRFYFDTENFHHLRTVYRQRETEAGFSDTIGMQNSSGGGFYGGRKAEGDWSANSASNGSTLTEDFEEIRDVDGLTLPHKYSIVLNIDGNMGTREFKYVFTFAEHRIVKEFPVGFFSFSG